MYVTRALNAYYFLCSFLCIATVLIYTVLLCSLKAGACWVNSHNLFDAAAGFGGYRESGFGRDGGKEVRRLEE